MLGKEEGARERVTRLTVKSDVEIEFRLQQTTEGEGGLCELAKLENDRRKLQKKIP